MNAMDILGGLIQAGMTPQAGDRLGNVLGQVLGGAMGGGGAPGAGAPQGMPAGGGLADLLGKIAGSMGGGAPGGGMPQGMPAGGSLADLLGKVAGSLSGGAPGGGMPQGMPQGIPQAAPGGGNLADLLGKVAGSMLGGGAGGQPGAPGGQGGGFPAEILKQVAGAVLGGGTPGGNAAAGAGSMAIFGALAMQALQIAKSMMAGGPPGAAHLAPLDPRAAMFAGMRPPETPEEQQQVADIATLTLRAMFDAAKADGHLDAEEQQRLLGKLEEGGISEEEKAFVAAEMQRPIDLDGLVRAVPDQQVAAQIYTASLLAITVDTDAERQYLAELARRLQLDPNAVAYLHQSMGIA